MVGRGRRRLCERSIEQTGPTTTVSVVTAAAHDAKQRAQPEGVLKFFLSFVSGILPRFSIQSSELPYRVVVDSSMLAVGLYFDLIAMV